MAAADRPEATFDTGKLNRTRIADLARALADPEVRLDAAEPVRSLMGQVVLTPGAERGEVHIVVEGALGALPELIV